jgi:cobalt-zinc-cadmium efflux system outer membrane protein
MRTINRRRLLLWTLVSVLALPGCAAVQRTAGLEGVDRQTKVRLGEHAAWLQNRDEDRAAEAKVGELLKGDLTVETAVRIALVNNRGLQATYERLGIAQADLVQAGLLDNPELGLQYLFGDEGDLFEVTVIQPLMRVVTLAARKQIGTAQAERVGLEVAQSAFDLAMDVKGAYYAVLADAQAIELLHQVTLGTEAAAQLAARQYRAGTLSRKDQALQQVFYAQSALDTAQAQARLGSDRERLNRLLGLWGQQTHWKLPGRLPQLPCALPPLDRVEQLAVEQRLDLAAATREVEAVYRAYGLTRDTRLLSSLGLGVTFKREPSGEHLVGPDVVLSLPLFDQGQSRVARIESELRMSERRLEALAVDARSQARAARLRLQAAFDAVNHYHSALLPLQQTVVEETLKFYNGMLVGVYELLLAQQAQVLTAKQYVEANKEFWLAWVDLERAVGASVPAPQAAPHASAMPAPQAAAASSPPQSILETGETP